jgi:hypothetical protein
VLLVICVAILIGVSAVTDPPPDDKVNGLTFATAKAERGPAGSSARKQPSDGAKNICELVVYPDCLGSQGSR